MTESTKVEYKDTLNLPQTTLAMRANATVRELEIQKFWEENDIYNQIISSKDKSNSFVLHDGPPYLSSEKIHVGPTSWLLSRPLFAMRRRGRCRAICFGPA